MHFDLVRDDHPLYITNPVLRRPPSLKEIFASPTSLSLPHMAGADRMYRPFLALTVIADRTIWGVHAGGFHLTSLLVHLAVVILLWRMAGRITRSRAAAFASAAIFAVHPSAVEAVAFLSARMDLFVALGAATTFVLLRGCLGRWGPWRLLGALLAFAFALLSKETALAIPPLVTWTAWVYPAWFAETDPSPRRSALAARVIPFWALLGSYVVLRNAVIGGFSPQAIRLVDMPAQMLRAFAATAYYGEMTLIPLPTGKFISPELIRPPTGPGDARVLAGLVLVTLLGAGLLWLARHHPPEAFALGWYVAALAPASNILPIYGEGAVYVTERSLYPALVGWCLFLGIAGQRLCLTARGPLVTSRALPRILAGAALGTFTVVTVLKVAAWRDNVTLWTAAAMSHPGNATIRGIVVTALAGAADLERAQAAAQEAAAEFPEDPDVASAGAWVSELRGDLGLALAQYERSITLGARQPEVFRQAAMSAAGLKEWDRAGYWFAQAADRFPAEAWPLVGLGWYHQRAGRADLARTYFEGAARREPRSGRRLWILGQLLAAEGRLEEAARAYQAALALDPGFVPASRELALLSERHGRIPEAIEYWRRIAAILPGINRTEAVEHLRRLEASAPGPAAGRPR
ncbi:MAG TPA: tetratricopeptide repeat protein [Candidatus Sulfotelmatobacter sp.]|nr:tetratricopeptide repeat protein [Candidatus Sulfotelmatobacter sp.]